MPLPLAAGLALAGGQILSTVIGGVSAGRQRQEAQDKAERAMREALAIIDSTGAPPDLSQKIIMQKFEQAGLLTPEVEQAITAGVSEASKVQEDSALREAQTSALQALQERGRLGLSAEDRAAFNKLRSEANRVAEGKRQQILQNFAARGQGGSGAELIAALTAGQDSVNQLSEQGDRIAAEASRNALEAITRGGTLGGQIRAQDFDVNTAKARAADEMRKFDIANRIGTQQRNVDRTNQSEQFNLSNLQRINDANTQMQNQELLRQNEAKRQRWLDQLNLNTAKANAMTGQASQAERFGQSNAQGTASTWGGIGQGIGAIGTYLGNLPAGKSTPSVGVTGEGGGTTDSDVRTQDQRLYRF